MRLLTIVLPQAWFGEHVLVNNGRVATLLWRSIALADYGRRRAI
jgi:hypothetical protein